MEIGIILLAAGLSKRMGRNKLYLPWGETTLLEALLQKVAPLGHPTCLVGKKEDDRARNLCNQYGIDFVANEDFSLGQSHSLQLGLYHFLGGASEMTLSHKGTSSHGGPASFVSALSQETSLKGCLCLVCDQPLLTCHSLEEIIKTFQKGYETDSKIIVRPMYGAKPGNPVLFSAYWYDALVALQGDEGGRQIFAGPGTAHVVSLALPPEEGVDVDTADAYERVQFMDTQRKE